jgi:hypothetical protein
MRLHIHLNAWRRQRIGEWVDRHARARKRVMDALYAAPPSERALRCAERNMGRLLALSPPPRRPLYHFVDVLLTPLVLFPSRYYGNQKS